MEINANQSFIVLKAAKIKSQGGKQIQKEGILKTITQPKAGDDGIDKIMVKYVSKGRTGEVESGAKFWIKVPTLVAYGKQT